MKKNYFAAAAIAALTLTSCGGLGTMGDTNTGSTTGNILGSIIGAATNGETISNILTSVIGLDKLSSRNLLGTWRYNGPGCAFTSENALAKAGGEVAATEVEQKLAAQYKKIGFNSQNTYLTFNQDGTFSAKIDGKPWNGQYTFDERTQSINFSGFLLNLKGYVKREANDISVLFESRKVLSLLQTISAMSGNSTLSTIGDISKNYDGVRIGFDMRP
jgi:putative lipoprotein